MDGPEIIVHIRAQNSGNEFQNPAGAAGVLTMLIDSQSPWQNGKTERAGQSFKHQLWDLDEECHIDGETEFEAASGRMLCRKEQILQSVRFFGGINACLVPAFVYLKAC